jgi:hypothetical protein
MDFEGDTTEGEAAWWQTTEGRHQRDRDITAGRDSRGKWRDRSRMKEGRDSRRWRRNKREDNRRGSH